MKGLLAALLVVGLCLWATDALVEQGHPQKSLQASIIPKIPHKKDLSLLRLQLATGDGWGDAGDGGADADSDGDGDEDSDADEDGDDGMPLGMVYGRKNSSLCASVVK